jgi:hypothetical protein
MNEDLRIKQLLELHHPRPQPEEERWLAAESTFGIPFPQPYKNLIDTFGASTWGDFLHIFSPLDQADNLRFVNTTLAADRESRQSWPEHYPFPLYPESGGLFPWARTDNGDTCYWITAAAIPEKWPTLIRGPRAPEFEVKFIPVGMLVYGIVTGKLRSSILPPFE